MGELIFGMCIYIFVALIMIGVGFSMFFGKKPTGFYTGGPFYKPEEIKDVKKWNHKHGIQWFIYGGLIIISSFIPLFVSFPLVEGIPALVIMLYIPVLVLHHHYLCKKYLIK